MHYKEENGSCKRKDISIIYMYMCSLFCNIIIIMNVLYIYVKVIIKLMYPFKIVYPKF